MSAEGRPLPAGWCWTMLADVTSIQGGLAKGKNRRVSAVRPVPYLRVANVQRGYLNLDDVQKIDATDDEIVALRLEPGDVLFNEGGDRDKLGRGWVWEGQIETCIHQNHVFRARPEASCLEPRFLSHYGNSEGRAYFSGNGSQTVNLASISKSTLAKLPVPLPPLAEQRRIVEKIEALTARSRRAREALEALPALLDRYRASVLAAAFRGDLTKDWRDGRPVGGDAGPPPLDFLRSLPVGWGWTTVGEAGDVSGGLTKNAKRAALPYTRPYLRVANVYADDLRLDDVQHFGVSQTELAKAELRENDLLVVEGNGSVDQIGRVALWDGSIVGCVHQNHIIKVRFASRRRAEFALLWLLSPAGRRCIETVAASSSGLHTLSLSKVKALPMPVADEEEAGLIVARVRSALARMRPLEDLAAAGSNRLTTLDQSILAKAFRGELVPQDPTDEPASALLERIRERRAAVGAGPKR